MTKWKKEEVEILRNNMDNALNKLRELLPTKTDDQILEKIKLIYRQNPSNKWTPEEDAVIMNNKNLNAHDLMKFLPHRSYFGILGRRTSLIPPTYTIKRNPLTKEEVETLTKLKKDGYSIHEMSEIMNRSLNSVKGALYNNNLARRYGRQTLWTKQQELFIIDNIKKGNTVEYVAKALNSTYKKIVNKALHLGFTYKDIITEVKKEKGERYLSIKARDEKIKELKSEVKTLNSTVRQLNREIKKGKITR
jgi:hypothetical protein